ncbi:hypothetical protein O6H91_05G001500 [Diphasiastrum complanatum]|uniref:Uncharacterized protein n=1 Tax=Diphasiastrum complanatum TaxID=34168 RepID=A0ACC2DKE0_DIPCM|nr:hypothetical protein O6H91_05G001500 [Diphasiastrum complanatum]
MARLVRRRGFISLILPFLKRDSSSMSSSASKPNSYFERISASNPNSPFDKISASKSNKTFIRIFDASTDDNSSRLYLATSARSQVSEGSPPFNVPDVFQLSKRFSSLIFPKASLITPSLHALPSLHGCSQSGCGNSSKFATSLMALMLAELAFIGTFVKDESCAAERDPHVRDEVFLERMPTRSTLLDELQAACEVDRVVADPEERYNHGKPWNSYHEVKHIPDFVVYPRSTEEVVEIVKICTKHKVPIVPFGGATSLEGHLLSHNGGLTIDMNLMKGVKELHLEDMDVIVEPGIGWMELNEFLKPFGLFFPLDPGPGATIGGMCATRCSGSLAVRYGTMRDNVISMKVVLANGDIVKTASRARKSAAGYDLTRLMIGSEGTLGVITEITLRLQKIPEASVVAMCNFSSIKDAADVAIATMHAGIQVSRVELLDEVQMRAINLANGRHYPEEPTLMFELIGTEAYTSEQTIRLQKIAEEHHASDFVFVKTPEEKEDLWKIRKEALWACATLRPGAEFMVTDVCVPLSKLAESISRSKVLLDASSLPSAMVSHAGDGNFHSVILIDPKNEEEVEEAHRLANEMVQIALSAEAGTCTGEHGVGVGKLKYLEQELGSEALLTMGKIKKTLDPNNIMNPGKAIPPQFCC